MDIDTVDKPLEEVTNGTAQTSQFSKPEPPPINTTAMSKTRKYRPYFTLEEIAVLGQRQRTGVSEDSQEKSRQLACTFMEAIGLRMGFPRKTVATGQTLYHRFRLFFPLKDFHYHDVSQATLYVSAKMHDTIKKPQDILDAGYSIRYPQSVNPVTGIADVGADRKADDRKKLLAIERLVLETICFNFTIQMAFPYVIKFSKALNAPKDLAKLAWRLCADSHRTLIGLIYPPHAVALASIYLAGLLATFELNGSSTSEEAAKVQSLVTLLSDEGEWEVKYLVKVDDLEEICHSILDLLVSQASAVSQSYNTSPATPTSPSPYPSPRTPNPFKSGASNIASITNSNSEEAHVFTAPHLTRLKIALRKQEATLKAKGYIFRVRSSNKNIPTPTPITATGPSRGPQSATPLAGDIVEGPAELIGKNEGTVRFLFGPSSDNN